MNQLMSMLSEMKFGEDETDYFRRQMTEHPLAPVFELREACRLKYKRFEVERLMLDIRDGSQTARDKALLLLLSEAFGL